MDIDNRLTTVEGRGVRGLHEKDEGIKKPYRHTQQYGDEQKERVGGGR